MPATLDVTRRAGNGLLNALPPKELQRLQTHLELVQLELRQPIYEPGDPMQFIYFPTSGVLSLTVLVHQAGSVEVGMVGREGMACVASALGSDRSPMRTFVQMPGDALRLPVDVYRTELQRNGALHAQLHQYLGAYLFMVSQSAACNRFHSVEQRLCRWMLMSQDRLEGNQFLVTQEELANLLGVRRASVTEAAVRMQDANVVRYRWGKVTILNRNGLESGACECYRLIKERFAGIGIA